MRIGFIGAGNIGRGLARLALAAGDEVVLSNSRGPETLADLVAELGPGASAAPAAKAARDADLAVLTVPFTAVFEIDPELLADRVVLDTNNYYPTRDGAIAELDEHRATTSGMVQRHLAGAVVVKAFNAIMAGDLVAPFGLPGRRRALPVAADDPGALATATSFHERIGFDVVAAGTLAESWRFERAKPAYCIPLDRDGLAAALAEAERDVELPHNSWKRA